MPKKIKPVFNRVIVKRSEDAVPMFIDGQQVEIKDEKGFVKGSLLELSIKPEVVRQNNRQVEGVVAALGPHATSERFGIPLKEGDTIRYSFYSAGICRIGEERFDVINDEDVQGIVVEEN